MHCWQQDIFLTVKIRWAKATIKESSDSVRDQIRTKPTAFNRSSANEPSTKNIDWRAFVQPGKTEINWETKGATIINKKQDDMQEIIGNLWEHKKDSIRVHIRVTGQQWGRSDFEHKNSVEQGTGRGIEAIGTAVDINVGDGCITGGGRVHWGIVATIWGRWWIKVEFFSVGEADNTAGIQAEEKGCGGGMF